MAEQLIVLQKLMAITISIGNTTGFTVANASAVCDSTVLFTSTGVNPGATITWKFGDGTTATGTTTTHKYPAPGTYIVKQIITGAAPTNCIDSSTQTITVSSCSVSGGGGGGLETKTLGDVIAIRLYGNAINSVVEINGYNNTPKFIQSGTIVNGNPNDLTLATLVPASVLNTDAAYTTTPKDLSNFVTVADLIG